MINAGYDAVKAVNTATKVVIHLNDGQVNYQWWYDPMVNLGLKFDVIGMSLYPSTTTNWISDTTAGLNNLLYCNARYGKEVMVCETGLAEDAPQECQNMLVDLMNKTASVPDNKGLGVFYWEPESIYWGAGCYGFPGAVGIPTVAMNAFMYGTHQGDAPAAVYGFENNVLDSSGNGNNGTVNGSLTYTDGEVGDYAAQFNGINSWISIPDSIGSTSFTISLWINTTDGYGNEGDQWYEDHGLVDGEMPGVGNDFGTAIGGGYFKLGIGNPDTTLTSTVPVNDGTWHHVVATWNSTTGAMQIFLDGVLNASGTGPTGARTAVSNGLHIGNSHDGGNYFDGLLDDVELYNGIVPFPELNSL